MEGWWETPVVIGDSGRGLGLDVDRVSRCTHVLWRSHGKTGEAGTAYYTRVAVDNTQTKALPLDSKDRQTVGGAIVALGDSSNLFAALAMYRGSEDAQCNDYTKDFQGCIDIYIVTSKDNGTTWTEPTPVPRTNMYDFASRYTPTIMYLKEQRLIYVFYSTEGSKGRTIASVVYQNNFVVASSERDVANVHSLVPIAVMAGYTLDLHDNARIQLNWQQTSIEGKSGLFVQISSIDLGHTWSTPIYLCLTP